MSIDPNVADMLDALRAAGLPAMHEGSLEFIRAAYRSRTVDARTADMIVQVGEVRDILIPLEGLDLPARVYHPDTSIDVPTVAFFHGGGWVIGDLDTHDNVARNICRGSNSVVVSVEYRRAPEYPFPTPLEDSLMAARWVASQMLELGGLNVLGLAGDSSGANLAAVVAQQFGAVSSAEVSAQLLAYPVTDAGGAYPSRTENAVGYLLELATMNWFWDQYDPTGKFRVSPACSPLMAPLHAVPPTVLVTAGYDILRDEGIAYGDRLRTAGIRVQDVRDESMIHGFFGLGHISLAAQASINRATRMFGELLRGDL